MDPANVIRDRCSNISFYRVVARHRTENETTELVVQTRILYWTLTWQDSIMGFR